MVVLELVYIWPKPAAELAAGEATAADAAAAMDRPLGPGGRWWWREGLLPLDAECGGILPTIACGAGLVAAEAAGRKMDSDEGTDGEVGGAWSSSSCCTT